MIRVAAVGEVVEDRYLPEDDAYPGGISLNFARAARHAGAQVTVFGCLGDDERGARLRRSLQELRIDARLRVIAGPSALQWIRVAADGERVFCGFDAGVIPDYRLAVDELEELRSYDVVALPCVAELLPVMDQLLALPGDRRLVADFSKDAPMGDPKRPASWPAAYVDRLRLAFVGADRSAIGELTELSRRTRTLLVLTAGADGAYAFDGGRVLWQPAVAAEVVDTTGCGDAFQGAFTARWAADGDIVAALRCGADCAARVAGRKGAGV